jgi:hypothetical protein
MVLDLSAAYRRQRLVNAVPRHHSTGISVLLWYSVWWMSVDWRILHTTSPTKCSNVT